jgi:hypothetical protein
VVTCRGWPGSHSLFFAPPKKSKQKKGGRKPLPFGFPFVRGKKWEMKRTRCAQTSFISDPFSALHKRQRPKRGCVKVKRNFNVRSNGSFKNNGNFKSNIQINFNFDFTSSLNDWGWR